MQKVDVNGVVAAVVREWVVRSGLQTWSLLLNQYAAYDPRLGGVLAALAHDAEACGRPVAEVRAFGAARRIFEDNAHKSYESAAHQEERERGLLPSLRELVAMIPDPDDTPWTNVPPRFAGQVHWARNYRGCALRTETSRRGGTHTTWCVHYCGMRVDSATVRGTKQRTVAQKDAEASAAAFRERYATEGPKLFLP